MRLHSILEVTLTILFLLFAYFMIGGYTPKNSTYSTINREKHMDEIMDYIYNIHNIHNIHNSDYYPINADEEMKKIPNYVVDAKYDIFNDNIYESGPFLNI